MRGSVHKRASGRYAVVLDVGRDPETGRRRQKWVSGFATKGAAEDALVDLLGKRQRGETIDPDLTPFELYVSAWIDGRVDQLAPLSVTQYRSVVKNHVKGSALGAMPLGKIRRAHVRAHEAELVRKGLAPSTRNVVSAVVSRAFSDAVEDDLISVDPCAGRRRSTERQSKPKGFTVWTAAELRTLLETAEGDLELKLKATVKGDEIELDFSGSADQYDGNLNCPMPVTLSACYFALRVLTDPDVVYPRKSNLG